MRLRDDIAEALDLADELDRHGMECQRQANRRAFGLPEEPPEEDWKSARWLGATWILALVGWGAVFAWIFTRM